MLELAEIASGYGSRPVLQDVSMRVHPGEVVALVGPNGSGKSTLLRTIIGTQPLWAGEVRWRNEVLNRISVEARVRKGVSLMPQFERVFPGMQVRDNLELGCWFSPPSERADRRRYVLRLLPHLVDRLGQHAGTLSGGEQQMVSLGRAIAARPTVLLLDEPGLGLSRRALDQTLSFVSRLADESEVAVIIVEHRVPEVLSVADRVYGLRRGTVEFDLPASDLDADDDVLRDLYFG